MDKIDECVGPMGYNRSQVLNYILIDYFGDLKNQRKVDRLKKDYEEKIRTKKMRKRSIEDIEKEIQEIIKNATSISPEFLIRNINISYETFSENLTRWLEKFNLKLENDMLVKS
jgi:hypothetical protein